MRYEVRVTRMDETDSGVEMRVEIQIGDTVHEIVACDGIYGETVEFYTNGRRVVSD